MELRDVCVASASCCWDSPAAMRRSCNRWPSATCTACNSSSGLDLVGRIGLGQDCADPGEAASARAAAPGHGGDEQLGRSAVLVGGEDEAPADSAVGGDLPFEFVQDV